MQSSAGTQFEYDGDLNPHFAPGDFRLPIRSIRAYLPKDVAPR